MKPETERMFYEDYRGVSTCPECGKEAAYWGVESGYEDTLLDTLHCENCGFTWERVYKYAWSRRVED